jgi:hypothetical protein
MGSTLTREKHSINKNGTTHWDYQTPTMSIGGTKDGLMRVSRMAESFWHSNINVEKDQENLFPTIVFEGVSHAQFLSGEPPINVRERDLKPDVTLEMAHELTAQAMVEFFDQIITGNKPSVDIAAS